MCLTFWYYLFGGGVPRGSSPAFRFAPNPNATLVLSLGAGVPPCDVDGESKADDEILENPGFI